MSKKFSQYSVLMSVYYKEKAEFFIQAVESMLKQTVPPDDFVIVCDGPLTDELDKAIVNIESLHPSLFQIVRLKKNRGLANALNIGLKYCKNELVARMDSDDISLPYRMEKQLEVIERNPQVDVVGGQIAEFETDPSSIKARRIVPCRYEEIQKRVKTRNPMNHMTVIFKKSVVINVGGYPDINLFEDYALWATLISQNIIFMNVDYTCCYMRTGEGMYRRRGGHKYIDGILKIEKLLKEKELISSWEYFKNIAIRYIGAVLVTSGTREKLYKLFLRKM